MRHTIKLDVCHSIQIEPTPATETVRVSLCTGFVPVITKNLTKENTVGLILALTRALDEIHECPRDACDGQECALGLEACPRIGKCRAGG